MLMLVRQTLIAYCFCIYQRLFKNWFLLGNGNADGTFVYTGFRPAFFLFKRVLTYRQIGILFDDKRQGFNPNTSEFICQIVMRLNVILHDYRIDILV